MTVSMPSPVLKNLATETQTDLLTFLDTIKTEQIQVQQLWISNKVIVRGVDFDLLQKLMSRSDISKIEEEFMVPFARPVEVTHHEEGQGGMANEQWGVATIEAPFVWESGNNGSGAVVSSIDTGVRGTHQSLINNHRKEYGWFNPEKLSSTASDELGNGAHTMGTICGQTRGIGVATAPPGFHANPVPVAYLHMVHEIGTV